jgi:hypothetical protein
LLAMASTEAKASSDSRRILRKLSSFQNFSVLKQAHL